MSKITTKTLDLKQLSQQELNKHLLPTISYHFNQEITNSKIREIKFTDRSDGVLKVLILAETGTECSVLTTDISFPTFEKWEGSDFQLENSAQLNKRFTKLSVDGYKSLPTDESCIAYFSDAKTCFVKEVFERKQREAEKLADQMRKNGYWH